MMTRSEIREHIFRLVFCGEFHSGDELQEQVGNYLAEELPDAAEEDRIYIEEKFSHIKDLVPEIDARINAAVKGWRTSRMGKTELALLRLAVYEMHYDDNVPVKVAINEAVELAKRYGGDDSPGFVNGVLAKLT